MADHKHETTFILKDTVPVNLHCYRFSTDLYFQSGETELLVPPM